MRARRQVLIVGGGIGGMSTAITLARAGFQVDLIDLDPHWRVYGAGITITGPTLRAFQSLGILDEVMEHAYTGEGIQICNSAGIRLERLPTAMSAASGVPGSGGIMRPVLHKILADRVRNTGARVRLGVSVAKLTQDARGAEVELTDETTGRYDMVIGADGLFSVTRKLILPEAAAPDYTGQSVWRLVTSRPPEIDCRHYFLGGPFKVGLSPVSATQMYLFLLEGRARREPVPESDLPATLRELLAAYGGILGQIRDSLGAESPIVMRPLQAFSLQKPWHRHRTLLIGDAAHPTTPQLASGAGMAVEDALVLGEEAGKAVAVEQIYECFMARRYERCRLVVQNSLAIGRLEQAGASIAEQTGLVEQSLRALAASI